MSGELMSHIIGSDDDDDEFTPIHRYRYGDYIKYKDSGGFIIGNKMYDSVKYVVTGINSRHEKNVKSYLSARFKFKQESSPMDRVKINDRINDIELMSEQGWDRYDKGNKFKMYNTIYWPLRIFIYDYIYM